LKDFVEIVHLEISRITNHGFFSPSEQQRCYVYY